MGLVQAPIAGLIANKSVWVDGGQLHLRIREIDGMWHSAEVYSKACTQYGMHRFFMIGPLDSLDKNVVAAPFLYKDDQSEIDIEFAKWGVENPVSNTQYVVQPWDDPVNRQPFQMTLNGIYSTHYVDWSASAIQFKSIHGHYQEPPDTTYLIHEWLYMGNDIPAEEECLRIHINLWLYDGNPPSDGQEAEIIVKAAQFPEELVLQTYFPVVSRPR